MELNDQNLEALSTYLRKTLSPNGDERAEGTIRISISIARWKQFSNSSGENSEANRTQWELLVVTLDSVRTFDNTGWNSSCLGDHFQEFHQAQLAIARCIFIDHQSDIYSWSKSYQRTYCWLDDSISWTHSAAVVGRHHGHWQMWFSRSMVHSPWHDGPTIPTTIHTEFVPVDQWCLENSSFPLRTISLRTQVRRTLARNQAGPGKVRTRLHRTVQSTVNADVSMYWCHRRDTFSLVTHGLLSAERIRSGGNEKYLQFSVCSHQDLLRSQCTSSLPSFVLFPLHAIPFRRSLGITRTFWGQSYTLHDSFHDTSFVWSSSTTFGCK